MNENEFCHWLSGLLAATSGHPIGLDLREEIERKLKEALGARERAMQQLRDYYNRPQPIEPYLQFVWPPSPSQNPNPPQPWEYVPGEVKVTCEKTE